MSMDREEIQRRDAENAEGRGEDRPDLELVRLVLGDNTDGVRPAVGWFVLEDVVRGAVELIGEQRKRLFFAAKETGLQLLASGEWEEKFRQAEKAARQARADLATREVEVAQLREHVEALVGQLKEEEDEVKRLRAVILGSPKKLMLVHGTYEEVTVAMVRLDAKGLGLGLVEGVEQREVVDGVDKVDGVDVEKKGGA